MMAQISNNNLSPPNADAEGMVARARTLMIISALTTVIAIAAVVSVIGYRVLNSGGAIAAINSDGVVTLPKGARVISTVASGGRVAVLVEIGGASELLTFDIKTLKQTGRLRFDGPSHERTRSGRIRACMTAPSRLFRGHAPFV